MPIRPPDTAERSLSHWSAAGRAGMEAFYTLATRDYRQLEAARDWAAALRGRASDGRVRLLDVACGSGKFPSALVAGGLADRMGGVVVEVDLLDPSPFSIAEARGVLEPPFVAAAELAIGIEALDPDRAPYDVAWAVHALYAVHPGLLAEGLRRMHGALRPGGFGVVAQATAASHYLRIYEAYRAAHAPKATPFTCAEDVAGALAAQGVTPICATVSYRVRSDDRAAVEGFLQRCLFDDSLDLEAMCAPGPGGTALADFLATCRHGEGWEFTHEVHLLTWER